MKTAICAIIKDEHRYLKEWIDYHLGIGFSHIYIFEDYGSKSHEYIVKDYTNVTLQTLSDIGIAPEVWNDGKKCKRQDSLYNWALTFYKGKYDWLALIDVDEFFEFEDGYNLERLCTEFSGTNGIYLYWKVMTANGNVKYIDIPVRERFTKVGTHLKGDDAWTLKSFINLNVNENFKMLSCHECEGLVNTMGVTSSRIRCYKKAWLAHYFTKSWEEWLNRFLVRGSLVWGHRKPEEFFEINKDMLPLKKTLMAEYNHRASREKEWRTIMQVSDDMFAVQTSKCGCTTIAYCCLVYNMEVPLGDVHRVAARYKKNGKNKTGKLFSVYRDPLHRWLSFYQDKCVNDNNVSWWAEYKELHGKSIDSVIEETEKSLLNDSPFMQDQHIRRQVDTYPVEDIDIIVPIEHLDAFLESQGITPPPHQNVSKGEKPTLTPEQEARIKKLYAEDYELLKSPKLWKPLK